MYYVLVKVMLGKVFIFNLDVKRIATSCFCLLPAGIQRTGIRQSLSH